MRFSTLITQIIAVFIFNLVYGQKNEDIKWAQADTGYYKYEQKGIVFYSLPFFKKTYVADSTLLVPKGNLKPLTVQDFTLSNSGRKILLFTHTKKVWRKNTRGDYWLLDLDTKSLRQIGKGLPESSLMFAKFAPNEANIAYVCGHNLYVEQANNGKIKKLTKDGEAKLINGTFDWAYEEEFSCRDGFRWSPDSKKIAFWQIDARQIKDFLLINNTDSLYSFTKAVEYPKAGQDPAKAKIGVIDISSGKNIWINIAGANKDDYIPRMEWAYNSSELILEKLTRKQNNAQIYICNISSGLPKLIYQEKSSSWIEVKDKWSSDIAGWDWIEKGKKFIWVSEKDGWRHIYLLGRDGKQEILLTKGAYDMMALKGVDETNGYVYFMASPNNSTQSYLYKIALKGGEAVLVSKPEEQGTHNYNLSPKALFAFHNFSNYKGEELSEVVRIADRTAIRSYKLIENALKDKKRPVAPIEMFQLTTADGIIMDGCMIKPHDFDSTKKYPVLFKVYAEPNTVTVKDVAGGLFNKFYAGDLARDGYIQIAVEGRGTPAPKGADWRKAIYQQMGLVNIRDQAMAAREIMKWPFVDSQRIAVYGASGGGSTTLNLLFQYPDIYSTGIAIAPVANQMLYDNIYEERYMGLPQENPEVYKACSPITHAKGLKGNLLIIHGTGDDNVHYQGTEMLVNELVKNNKKFQLMSYPNRTHSISEGEGTQLHLSNLFTDFLKKNCTPGGVVVANK